MILLTMRDKQRIEVIQRVMANELRIGEAQTVLGRSERQVYRLVAQLRDKGIKGMIHGNCGRVSPRKLDEEKRQQIIQLAREKYQGFNDTHMGEMLAREERIVIGRETLRRYLRAAQIPPKKKRKARKYRCRRERKESMGVMLQIDASDHDWLEGRGPWLVLVGGIDDATNHVWAQFEDSESTWAYLDLMRDIILTEGIPLSLYSDRHTIFHSPKEPTIIEQLRNVEPLTQFGRAMKELGVEMIPAYSSQAKGRIERLWETFQDRLIAEMRLARIATKQDARKFLKDFLSSFNQRFGVAPRNRQKVFRKRPPLKLLDRILCLKETRVVRNDHTISFEGLVLQIPPSSKWASIANSKVEVLQMKDASVEIIYKGMTVARFPQEAINRMIEKYKRSNSQLKKVA